MADVPEVESTDPFEMLGVGRRHLAVRDYTSATETLAKACEIVALKYGQQADECGEAYFWYGKALLGLAREESGVLGDGLPGGEDNQEDEEEDNDEAEDENNDETEKDDSKTEAPEKIEGEVQNDDVNLDNTMETSEPEAVAGTSSSPVPSEDDEALENANPEDVENIQIAWEVFELARDIFLKRGERGKKELADVYVHLGEVGIESETYEKAILDMTKGLELYQEMYRPDDRRIAETHYQIGLSHSLSNGFDDAVLHFKKAAEILENRIKNLKEPTADSEEINVKKNKIADPFYTVEGEIKELTDLLPEIKEKIQDMIDYKAEALRSLRESLGIGSSNGQASTSNGNGSSECPQPQKKAASDISHLIKRKRGPDDDAGIDQGSPAKKLQN